MTTAIATVAAATVTAAKKQKSTKSCSEKSGGDVCGRGVSGGGDNFDVSSNTRRRRLRQSSTQYHKIKLGGRAGNGRKVRARGHNESRGRHPPEIEQSQRAATTIESGREGVMIAEDGGNDDS
jgi:hypothetical protein